MQVLGFPFHFIHPRANNLFHSELGLSRLMMQVTQSATGEKRTWRKGRTGLSAESAAPRAARLRRRLLHCCRELYGSSFSSEWAAHSLVPVIWFRYLFLLLADENHLEFQGKPWALINSICISKDLLVFQFYVYFKILWPTDLQFFWSCLCNPDCEPLRQIYKKTPLSCTVHVLICLVFFIV